MLFVLNNLDPFSKDLSGGNDSTAANDNTLLNNNVNIQPFFTMEAFEAMLRRCHDLLIMLSNPNDPQHNLANELWQGEYCMDSTFLCCLVHILTEGFVKDENSSIVEVRLGIRQLSGVLVKNAIREWSTVDNQAMRAFAYCPLESDETLLYLHNYIKSNILLTLALIKMELLYLY